MEEKGEKLRLRVEIWRGTSESFTVAQRSNWACLFARLQSQDEAQQRRCGSRLGGGRVYGNCDCFAADADASTHAGTDNFADKEAYKLSNVYGELFLQLSYSRCDK